MEQFISEKPNYNADICEWPHFGPLVGITPKQLPNVSVASSWNIEPCYMPDKIIPFADSFLEFEVRPDDVWIITFPKCGTTWTQEMIWLLANDLDYKGAAVSLLERYNFFEIEILLPNIHNKEYSGNIDKLNKARSPRFIKSHLPVGLLPKQLWTVKPTIIYTSRNPKDTAVSWYHHCHNITGYMAGMNAFFEGFLRDQIVYSPFHSHILNFWNMRTEKNILFLTFEDMKADLMQTLKLASKFLNKTYSDEQLIKLQQHLDFQKMRLNPSVNMNKIVEFGKNTYNVNKSTDSYYIFKYFYSILFNYYLLYIEVFFL